jgi:hypothetical protein
LSTFPTSSLSFIPAVSSDIRHISNPLTISSGEIHCHELDSLAQQFHISVLTKYGFLSRASQTTAVSSNPSNINDWNL